MADNWSVEVSVIIPTYGRPRKIAACVGSLAKQTLSHGTYEVLVGIDGGTTGSGADTEHAIRGAWKEQSGEAGSLKIVQCDKVGQAAVRNRLFPEARGRLFVFLNDDMVPHAGFLEAHAAAHRDRPREIGPALILGDSPWKRHEPDRLFDRLLRETSMVFFYDQMRGSQDRDRDWGFRHAWMLNLSIPAAAVREVGGLTVFPSTYGYEDDDLAFRLKQRFNTPILYRPQAIAVHDHQMDPREYLERERKLGFAAWGFAAAAPEVAQAMFNRDVRSPDELEYSRLFVERERKAAERLEKSFLELADLPAAAVGPDASRVINLIYEQHLLLKRWHWRKGLVEAAAAVA
jgi:GT2 family glycosyltransferase